ncbi:MAG: L-fucose/L-arabinose isomerase family protein [Vicinamibacterales bacterium]|nr:L-fucose/L-arabinose isomerase family protein [Vicinamibacterales bacterium]
MSGITVGLIVGNRGFFPDHLCASGRKAMIDVLEAAGAEVVALSPAETKHGSIESLDDAAKCAELFKANRERIAGVVVTLPNFGDERAIANALRWANLGVPVLVQAFPDQAGRMTIADRRDSFCGKMSACNNLLQYGIPFTLTRSHTVDPTGAEFGEDLRVFMATCRVVTGLRGARFGALGARPAAFNTVRYSEKLLERSGMSVETLDLSELFGKANRLAAGDARVEAKVARIAGYIPTSGVPGEAVLKMARMGVVIDEWMTQQRLAATAIQCWTSMEEFYGVVPCTLMSMMSDSLAPSACETDIAGLVGMYALRLASETPAALVDWNNNYAEDPDKAVVFHCSNLPKGILETQTTVPVMSYQAIIAGTVGRENTFGTVEGRIKASPFTYCRVSTDDLRGRIAAYVGEGEVTDDALLTFGGYGVVKIANFQGLLRFICEKGFEHHTAMSLSRSAQAIHEAFSKYLGWDVYLHA